MRAFSIAQGIMSQEQKNQEFRKLADSFIEVANKHCDTVDRSLVGSAMLFATARFASFVVASHARDQAHYESEIDNALAFFSDEFKRRLGDNLEEYKSVFAQQNQKNQQKPTGRYEHLMKKDKTDDA